MTIRIAGLHGLGDQLHQRPFIRAAAARETVYLETPWPQLVADLPNVRPVRANSRLRTQAKNEARGHHWHEPPRDVRSVRMTYGSGTMAKGSVHDALEAILPLDGQPFVYDAPAFDLPGHVRAARYAVVRPVTVRKEWSAVSRNCDPGYIAIAADVLRSQGFHVVSVADVDGSLETMLDPKPVADQRFHAGELNVEQLFGLIRHAAMVVTPVGWCLHAAIAYRRPAVCIAGGRGGHCAPWKETDPRQDLSRLRWIMPDRYCMCDQPAHNCTKEITDFRPRFLRTLNALNP